MRTNAAITTPGPDWIPPSPEIIAPLLPEYRIDRLLGAGGMGTVYGGTQHGMDRPCAIKILPLSGLENDEMNYAERFRQEARSMAKLNHPAIVSVYDLSLIHI